MQTLGLSDSTARSENRLKSLFWPSIQTATDLDYLGAQGFWVCAIAAALTLLYSAATGHAIAGAFLFLFYYLGGVGVRERSRYAATIVFVMFVADTVLSGVGVPRIIISGLLLSNLRATWIAARWRPKSNEAAAPPRFNESWSDKLVDQLPTWLWPKIRITYYIFSACFAALVAAGVAALIFRHRA